jgi:hypothetical protein
MSDKISHIRTRIRELETELEEEFEGKRQAFKYHVEHRRVIFESGVKREHTALRQKLTNYIARANPLVVLTAPAIYALIIPFVILDVFVSLYQSICFPVYKIAKVRRSEFIVFDRKHLSYLNGLEKINCAYCSYGNGILAYASEVAGRTEAHWCPIKHAKRMEGMHAHYHDFVDFGDAEGFRKVKQDQKEQDQQD